MSDLLEKLSSIHDRRSEVSKSLADPSVIADQKRFVQLNREYRDLAPIEEAYFRYKRTFEELQGAKEMLRSEKDPEMLDMARAAALPGLAASCPPDARAATPYF